MRTRNWLVLGVALAALVSVPAIAQAATDAPQPAAHEHAKFPMTAAEFKTKVDARTTKARAEMEKHAATLPADKARELRAEFDRGLVRVNQEVTRVGADGKVTKEEAKEVRKVAREAHIGRGGHHRGHHRSEGKDGGK